MSQGNGTDVDTGREDEHTKRTVLHAGLLNRSESEEYSGKNLFKPLRTVSYESGHTCCRCETCPER